MKDQVIKILLPFNVIVLILGGSACAERSTEQPIEGSDVDSQEYIDEAYTCVYLFQRVGEKRMSHLSLANIIWSIENNPDLEHIDVNSKAEAIEAQITEFESLFKESNVTKREIIFYLISSSSCLSHVGMGGVWLFLNKGKE